MRAGAQRLHTRVRIQSATQTLKAKRTNERASERAIFCFEQQAKVATKKGGSERSRDSLGSLIDRRLLCGVARARRPLDVLAEAAAVARELHGCCCCE